VPDIQVDAAKSVFEEELLYRLIFATHASALMSSVRGCGGFLGVEHAACSGH
jgi:hypothetical protein